CEPHAWVPAAGHRVEGGGRTARPPPATRFPSGEWPRAFSGEPRGADLWAPRAARPGVWPEDRGAAPRGDAGPSVSAGAAHGGVERRRARELEGGDPVRSLAGRDDLLGRGIPPCDHELRREWLYRGASGGAPAGR